nr:hypothetical protein [Burkholderia ubonensis]
MINSIGNLGGFVGPFAIGWLKNVTGGYAAGLYVVADGRSAEGRPLLAARRN